MDDARRQRDANSLAREARTIGRALARMCRRRIPDGVRAELLATAMVDYEKSLGGIMTAEHEEWIIRGWSLVYYFRVYPHQCDYMERRWRALPRPMCTGPYRGQAGSATALSH